MPDEFTYVIEHMEDDDEVSKTVPPWVDLEYAHMRTLAGPKSRVLFTNLSKVSAESLENKFKSSASSSTSENLAEVSCRTAGILDLIKEELGGSLEKVCLLDPKAEKEISPEDGDGRFEWFLFGVSDLSYIFHEESLSIEGDQGILGDDPPRDRTGELRVLGFPGRHLGPVQMTTDTALGVTKRVVHDKGAHCPNFMLNEGNSDV
ncbi:hypothetical protein PQX77_009974 [Marasmius sp. AFHP31]|nr:hypothetical protein PQX77_009974 [Marasmius sp. AFHP31]